MNKKTHKNQTVRRMALRYTAEGFAVVPLHGTNAGKCTCGCDDCAMPGRHPRTGHGIQDATTDRVLIKKRWARWPKAKIGLAMGTAAGFVAIIADGDAGRTSLRQLKEQYTKTLPKTVTYRDGERRVWLFATGGAHLCDRSHALGAGLKVVGDGDFVVAPSRKAERRFVSGQALGEIDVALVPPWLVHLINVDTVDGTVTASSPPAGPSVIMTRASDITPENIEWIWPGFIARRRVTGLVGYPGMGKSQVAIDFAATVSTGRNWPGGTANGNRGRVIILSAEDDAADMIVPRLIAAGGDRDRVDIVKAVRGSDGSERAFNLATDLDWLTKEYDLKEVRLVLIDPVSAYLGSAKGKPLNRNDGGDVRAIQGRLGVFATNHDLAVMAVSHLNKSGGTRAITKVMGSLEWVAAPRAVFLVTEEAGTDRRLFLPLKNNLAPDRLGYAFRIEDRIVPDEIKTSALVWDHDPITISAEEALLATAAKKPASGVIEFLQQAFSDGPMPQSEIIRLGKDAGYSEKILRTGREALGIKPKKQGFGAQGKWVWVPPGGATLLKMVVNNDAHRMSPPSGKPINADAAPKCDDKDPSQNTDMAVDSEKPDTNPETSHADPKEPGGDGAA